MEFLTSAFLGTFVVFYSVLHPLFKRPVLATYVVIFLTLLGIAFRLFIFLKSQKVWAGNAKRTLRLLIFWAIEIYLVFMLFWYIFVHFKTVSVMQ